MRQKIFDGKSWYSLHPSPIQTFSVPETSETLKGSPTKFCGTVGQKVFDGKSWYPPPSYPNIFDTPNYCNSKVFPPTEFFGTVRQKIFDGKSWYSLPPSCSNFSVPEINETHQRTPTLRNFSALRDKNFSTKKLDTPPLFIQTFSLPEIIATVKDSRTEIFGTVRQQIFDGKSWYSLHPSLIQTFSVPETSETLKVSATKFFGTVGQKLFDGKSWHSPPSHPNFFDTRNFCNSKRFPPYGNFRHCETKSFRRKILILSPPPPLIQTFSIAEIIATEKDSPTEIFGTVWRKIFEGKTWYSPPPISYPNFFHTRNYCNSKGFPYRNFRHCETKNFRRKILILPPLSLIQTFSIPETIATVNDYPTEIFGTVGQKPFDAKSWYSSPPLLSKLSRYPKLLQQ